MVLTSLTTPMCPVTCLPQAKHKSYFGPFITGNYDGYLSEMSRLGTWGGHVELQVCFAFKLLCFALLCFALLCFAFVVFQCETHT